MKAAIATQPISIRQGFLYLVAIIDWATRRVLSWRLSNTLTAELCVEALSEALAGFGKPDIFNTDQGAQFTSDEFTQMLRDHEIARTLPLRQRVRARGHQLGEPVDRHARAAKRRIPAMILPTTDP
jgi:transposase InsO family protein